MVVARNNRDMPESLHSEDTPLGKKGNGVGKFDNSLCLVTQKFVQLLKESPNSSVDLNKACSQLAVPKRRIYDITNVLEGIGMIEKIGKNIVRWMGSSMMSPFALQQPEALAGDFEASGPHLSGADGEPSSADVIDQLREELARLEMEEDIVTEHLSVIQDQLCRMASDEYCKSMAYITHEDIRRIASFSEDTLLAVKAPYGSTLEVPDPDEGMAAGQRRYEIQLSSRTGPIDVFLIQDTLPAAQSHMQEPLYDEALQSHIDYLNKQSPPQTPEPLAEPDLPVFSTNSQLSPSYTVAQNPPLNPTQSQEQQHHHLLSQALANSRSMLAQCAGLPDGSHQRSQHDVMLRTLSAFRDDPYTFDLKPGEGVDLAHRNDTIGVPDSPFADMFAVATAASVSPSSPLLHTPGVSKHILLFNDDAPKRSRLTVNTLDVDSFSFS